MMGNLYKKRRLYGSVGLVGVGFARLGSSPFRRGLVNGYSMKFSSGCPNLEAVCCSRNGNLGRKGWKSQICGDRCCFQGELGVSGLEHFTDEASSLEIPEY